MKKFRFSLETVLKVRRGDEELKRRELAQAQAERDRIVSLLSLLRGASQRLAAEQSRRRVGSINLARESWYQAGMGGLAQKTQLAKEALAGKEAALDAARLRAVEASRARLVLEKLEEKQLREHLFLVNREEQGLLDDRAQRALSVFSLASASTAASDL